MKTTHAHFKASLESFHEDEMAEGTPVDVIDAVSQDVDEAYRSVSDNVATVLDQFNTSENDLVTLEALAESLEEYRETGMDATAGQLTRISVEGIQQRYGIDSVFTTIPSMECFEGPRSLMAMTISQEGVAETAAKVWEWIKEKWAEFWAAAKRLWQRLTKNLDLMKDQAYAIKKYVQRNKFESAGTIDIGRTINKVSIEGKLPSDFNTPMNVIGALTRAIDSEIPEAVYSGVEDFKKWLSSSAPLPSSTPRRLIPKSFSVVNRRNFFAGARDILNTYASPLLPGDRHVVVGTFGDNNATESYSPMAMGMIKAKVLTHRVGVQKDPKIDAFSSQDIFTAMQRVEKAVAALKTSRSEYDSVIEKIKSEIDSLSAEYRADKGALKQGWNKMATWMYKTSGLYTADLMNHCESIAFDVLLGYIQIARKSIVAAKGEEALAEIKL